MKITPTAVNYNTQKSRNPSFGIFKYDGQLIEDTVEVFAKKVQDSRLGTEYKKTFKRFLAAPEVQKRFERCGEIIDVEIMSEPGTILCKISGCPESGYYARAKSFCVRKLHTTEVINHNINYLSEKLWTSGKVFIKKPSHHVGTPLEQAHRAISIGLNKIFYN